LAEKFLSALNKHIMRVSAKFRVQGPEKASTLCAGLFDYGNVESLQWQAFVTDDGQLQAALEGHKTSTGQTMDSEEQEASLKEEQRRGNFRSLKGHTQHHNAVHSIRDSTIRDATSSGA
jgi:hypothetical protein